MHSFKKINNYYYFMSIIPMLYKELYVINIVNIAKSILYRVTFAVTYAII